MAAANLTAERLRELLHYCPETGIFMWRVDRYSFKGAGSVAGRTHKYGYVIIKVENLPYRASRLAFLYMTGEWPKHMIDHRDTNRANNKWDNLREATNAENKQNVRTARGDNRSCGLLGVSRHGSRWQARIGISGEKRKHLGTFDTPELAYAAYVAAKRQLHPFCTI